MQYGFILEQFGLNLVSTEMWIKSEKVMGLKDMILNLNWVIDEHACPFFGKQGLCALNNILQNLYLPAYAFL